MSGTLPEPDETTLVKITAKNLDPMVRKVAREEIKWRVGNRIFDHVSGQPLDAKTCLVFLDHEGSVQEVGDPAHLKSELLLKKLRENTSVRYYAVGL